MTEQSGNVDFHIEEVEFESINESKIRNWILSAILAEQKMLSFINIIFCNDNYLHQLNNEYLNHDTLTDVITFQYNRKEEAIEGDIFISIDRVKDNAADFEVTFPEELNRVIIHGCLHLMGYLDKTEEQKNEIRTKENYYLSKLEL